MNLQLLVDNFQRGTTCKRFCQLYWQGEGTRSRFVLMKHSSHAEYIDRCSGVDTCKSYYVLFDLDNLPSEHGLRVFFGEGLDNGSLGYWTGRWNKKKQEEMLQKISEYERMH